MAHTRHFKATRAPEKDDAQQNAAELWQIATHPGCSRLVVIEGRSALIKGMDVSPRPSHRQANHVPRCAHQRVCLGWQQQHAHGGGHHRDGQVVIHHLHLATRGVAKGVWSGRARLGVLNAPPA